MSSNSKTAEAIISKVKSHYWKTMHKFRIQLPKSVKEALEIDRATYVDFWRKKAIHEAMSKVKVAWAVPDGHTPQQVREGNASEFISYQEIGCHMVFDIKMDFM